MVPKAVTVTAISIVTVTSTIADNLQGIYFEFLNVNEAQCPYYLLLKDCSVYLIHVFTKLSVVTVTLYITFSVLRLTDWGI